MPIQQFDEDCFFDIFITYEDSDHKIMESIYLELTGESKIYRPFTVAFNDKDFIPGIEVLRHYSAR